MLLQYICSYMENYFNKLKSKWNIESNVQLFIILLVFSITGSSALVIAKPILSFLNITADSLNPWIYRPLRILIIFPIYQVLILIIGAIFGQFKFFWNFEKKILSRMGFKRFLKLSSGVFMPLSYPFEHHIHS